MQGQEGILSATRFCCLSCHFERLLEVYLVAVTVQGISLAATESLLLCDAHPLAETRIFRAGETTVKVRLSGSSASPILLANSSWERFCVSVTCHTDKIQL